jgi:hypothetical protein
MAGRYCPQCGEKRIGLEDRTLRRFFEHSFAAFTHVDGKVFRTLRLLLAHPGRLTADHFAGRRIRAIPPLQLFLICNLIFFLLHPLIGVSNTLTTDLDTHLHYMWHSAIVQSLVTPRLAARSLTVEGYAALFNPAAVTLAKTLVILLVPMFSLTVMALYWRHRRHCTAHLVFALHVGAFWLLYICASLMLTNFILYLLRKISVFPTADRVIQLNLAMGLVVMTWYLYQAARVAFSPQSAWLTLAKAATLSLALVVSLQAYRLVLFFITFWST